MENKIIDFKIASEKVHQLRAKGELYSLLENNDESRIPMITGESLESDYELLIEELMWFFFLLSDADDIELWQPSLQIKFLILILEGIIFQELGEGQEFQSVFLKHALDTLKVSEIKMFSED